MHDSTFVGETDEGSMSVLEDADDAMVTDGTGSANGSQAMVPIHSYVTLIYVDVQCSYQIVVFSSEINY